MKSSATAHEDPARAAAISKIYSIAKTLKNPISKKLTIKVRAVALQPPRSELSQTQSEAPMNMSHLATGESARKKCELSWKDTERKKRSI